MGFNYYLGLDIGGTKCAVIAGMENMEILDKIIFPPRFRKDPTMQSTFY